MPPKYKPGGRTFPPKIKPTSLPPQTLNSIPGAESASTSTSNSLDREAEDKFEVELCWCIQQLQTALDSGKLTEKQTLDTSKTLNVLKSNTAPLIKKRQFMRTTFGDYRTKMANEQKKLGKTSTQVKFTPSTNDNKKSIFLRKAAATDAHPKPIETKNTTGFRILPSDNNSFKFNFSDPQV
ncbi:UPF0488 protein CG14286 [Neodiprion virginianus]|uniref:UPF0488 protein CG14286 n=1 Tax=Neodiprion lecontei TaxID=441921 RepID=A0A6J0BQU0_NEOLC|nr:UPF0488 protein CG14286 [Neodiprion lecontei]XP_046482253.1 UPF0488 protein CG14286 [Neodiprion pinetum]XP_046618405.1 UPF0488 protein CG14286 [Neodiprion virginianus]